MRAWIVIVVLVASLGCRGGGDGGTAAVSGAAGDLMFGPSVTAIAGTPWGIDDGLHIMVTDAKDPCGAWTEGRRQPNTSMMVLQFADATEATSSDFVPSEAGAGDYTFVPELRAPGRWFRVVRAYRLDGSCVPTEPGIGDAVAGAGVLDRTVRIPGGRAVGSFSADFAGGSMRGTFSAPFCSEPMVDPACDYFSPASAHPACGMCGTGPRPDAPGSGSGGSSGSGSVSVADGSVPKAARLGKYLVVVTLVASQRLRSGS
jgi:hypothetical protein